MMTPTKKITIAAAGALAGAVFLLGGSVDRLESSSGVRSLRAQESARPAVPPPSEGGKGKEDAGKDFFADSEWCLPPKSPPLPYDECENTDVLYKYGVFGGLTNALGFILKGALQAFEDGVCFAVDQTGPGKYAPMATRDPPLENVKNFLGRYFEPIGLPYGGDSSPEGMKMHPIARDVKKTLFYSYPRINERESERIKKARKENGGKRSVLALNWHDKDNVTLKKGMVRRMWRLLPERRRDVCSRLSTHGIDDEYMALSVRRGDKKIEYDGVSESITMQSYIDQAERAIQTHFNGRVPTVFVATDDCTAVGELRSLRPSWTFVSECDRESEKGAGFVLGDMVNWTLEQTDAHYEKFFAELIGMATAKYWIGVSFTNVSLWVYFMRGYDRTNDSWVFVDDVGGTVSYM